MSELLGTTVEEVIQVMKERRVRIPSEIGAFVALEVCEALSSGPATVRKGDIRIADDGSISVFAPPGSATSQDAARSVVALLGSLLVAAGTGVPRVLVGLMENGPSSGRWDLSSLRDDLEASLVPLNRGAARRVLARMLREVRKPRSQTPEANPASPPASRAARPPTDNTLDAQLDDLLGGPPDAPAAPEPEPPDDLDAMLDATMSELSEPPPKREAPPAAYDSDATLADDSVPYFDEPGDEPVDEPVRRFKSDAPTGEVEHTSPASDGIDLEALGAALDRPKKSSPLPWLLAFVAIFAATAAAVALTRPDLVDAMLGRPPPPPPDTGPTEEDRERMLREHRARWGTLTVLLQPEDSQVFMFIGRGPADAEEIPIGAANEFVAIADGLAPARAVLPADAEWSESEDGMRYDLAIQVGSDEMPTEELALGETRLMGIDMGGPTGGVGTVRVITNPPGAKVYLLIGFSPRVIIENIPAQEAVELIAWHEEYPVARAVLGPSDWEVSPDGSKTATVTMEFEGYEAPEAPE